MKGNLTIEEIAKKGVNYKTLAQHVGISDRSLRRQIQVMLEDPELKKQFGHYRFRRLTAVQLQILAENIPHVMEYVMKAQ